MCYLQSPSQWWIQDFPEEGRQPQGWGRQLIILPNFPKNCMKMKTFGSRGAHPCFDPPMQVNWKTRTPDINDKTDFKSLLWVFSFEICPCGSLRNISEIQLTITTKGGAGTHALSTDNFFIFMYFRKKIGQIIGWPPP